MSVRGETRKIERSPEDHARIAAIRERFQRERPTHEELIASGDYDGPFAQDAAMSLFLAVAKLKAERQRKGLTLADVSERSGLDVGMLSRLENGKVENPTLSTLGRYAHAVGLSLEIHVGEPTP